MDARTRHFDSAQPFAAALRARRRARRMSQMELALASGLSARHLSFLETGRARPSRASVMALADALALPLGAQNALLQAAGFAAVFPVGDLKSEALAPFRAALADMAARHAPYPALICDRRWTLIEANPAAAALLAPLRAGGEDNLILMLANSPAAPEAIVNYAEIVHEMTARIRLEAQEAGEDAFYLALIAALAAAAARHPFAAPPSRRPVAPIVIRTPAGELSFLSLIAQFGTSEDVVVRDLRLELFFPADDQTRAAMPALAASSNAPVAPALSPSTGAAI